MRKFLLTKIGVRSKSALFLAPDAPDPPYTRDYYEKSEPHVEAPTSTRDEDPQHGADQ